MYELKTRIEDTILVNQKAVNDLRNSGAKHPKNGAVFGAISRLFLATYICVKIYRTCFASF